MHSDSTPQAGSIPHLNSPSLNFRIGVFWAQSKRNPTLVHNFRHPGKFDPYIVYRIMSAGTPAQTNIGNNADVVAGAGSANTGQSGFSLNGTMASGTATCKILALWDGPANEFGQYAQLEVLINEHLLKSTTGI